jgi:CheY-like chemotaxis protein/HPt (histidine-containing phosphotransfer) domain-containing protein
MMEGSIGVDSEPGKGSRFFFEVVFKYLRKEGEKTAVCDKLVPIDLNGVKTLVVDDHSTSRLIIKEMLTDWGAAVHEVGNGKQALEELKNARRQGQPFQLLLLDRMMPEMDGFETARHLQNDPGLTGACVLMLSSDFGPGDIAQSRKLGIHRYLVKPVKWDDLKQVIYDAFRDAVPAINNNTGNKAEEVHEPRKLPASGLLLVEDSVPNQSVVEAFLATSPVEIDIADNGKIALEKFKKNEYGLVLMDIQMPVMDGLTATRKIRKWEKENTRPPTPILAMTAHALVGDTQKSLEAGCDGHLAKPIKRKDFLETVGKYLEVVTERPRPRPGKRPASHTGGIIVHVDPILKPYLPAFLKSLNQNIATIKDILKQGDFDKIEAIAHKMKGEGGTYGFDGVGKLGAQIQIAAENKLEGEIKKLANRMADYLKLVEVRDDRRGTR